MRGRLIVDSDGGIDDVFAVRLAKMLSQRDVCITTVGGNVSAQQAAQTLAFATGMQPMVGLNPAGWKPMLRHGSDGINGHWDQCNRPLAEGCAVDLLEQSLACEEDVIACIGPLTNIASALNRLNRQRLPVKAHVFALGGVGDAPRDVTDTNFNADPESAYQCQFIRGIQWISMEEAARMTWSSFSDWNGHKDWKWVKGYAKKTGAKWGSDSHFPLYDVAVVVRALGLDTVEWGGLIHS
ncbi:nucleoside hydrolase [Corynebacterium kroppenstedtii]|uniref:nucleoside hydrolase n=1 Tax=Corynebacterium sp. PCR 32 TaxID=3351342 RepID=UPI00309FBF18